MIFVEIFIISIDIFDIVFKVMNYMMVYFSQLKLYLSLKKDRHSK